MRIDAKRRWVNPKGPGRIYIRTSLLIWVKVLTDLLKHHSLAFLGESVA